MKVSDESLKIATKPRKGSNFRSIPKILKRVGKTVKAIKLDIKITIMKPNEIRIQTIKKCLYNKKMYRFIEKFGITLFQENELFWEGQEQKIVEIYSTAILKHIEERANMGRVLALLTLLLIREISKKERTFWIEQELKSLEKKILDLKKYELGSIPKRIIRNCEIKAPYHIARLMYFQA